MLQAAESSYVLSAYNTLYGSFHSTVGNIIAHSFLPGKLFSCGRAGLVNCCFCERAWLGFAQPGTLAKTTIHKPCPPTGKKLAWQERMCYDVAHSRMEGTVKRIVCRQDVRGLSCLQHTNSRMLALSK